jgi:hypothetical protein
MRFVIVIAAFLGCSKAEPPLPRAASDGVELLSHGQGEQRVLRYRLVKGTRSTLELAIDNSLVAGGRTMISPTLLIKLELAIEDVLPDGSARVRTTILSAAPRERTGATIPVGVLAQMASSLPGTMFTAKLSPSGRVSESKVETTKDLPAPIRAQVDKLNEHVAQVAMPLPEVPVATGAKWSVRSDVDLEGMKLATVTTTELTKLEGDIVTFASSTTISAPNQKLAQDGISAELTDIGGGGRAKGVVDLARMSMDGTMDLEFRGTMSSQGVTAPLKMTMALTTRPL